MTDSTLKRDGQYFESCPVIFALNILSKKWVVPVICELGRNKVCRFNDMMREIDGITTVMLTHVLKSLQGLGIVSRIQYNEMPLRVEYSLTPEGEEFLPSIFSLARWGASTHPCKANSSICSNANCPARNLQNLNARSQELSSSTQVWDNDFLEGRQYIEAQEPDLDPIDKMQYLFEYTLKKSTENGEEISRLKTFTMLLALIEATSCFLTSALLSRFWTNISNRRKAKASSPI